ATLVYQGIADGVTHQYRFFSIGIDGAGNIESAPASPDDVLISAAFAPPGPLALTGFSVQHASPSRSYVRYLDLTFDQAGGPLQALVDSVNHNPDFSATQAIRLYKFNLDGDGSSKTPVSLQQTLSIIDHVIEIDFGPAGIGGSPNTTAADGYYELDVAL